jgi:integrase/recombinase XerD
MSGKQAKLLTNSMVAAIVKHVRSKRYPVRDLVMVLLSTKAGLRAGEIANLTWAMVLDAKCRVSDVIALHDRAAKKLSGRIIPMHPELRKVLVRLHKEQKYPAWGHVVLSERKSPMEASSIVKWFIGIYRELNYEGCSSHSGRRSFVTKAARTIHLVGGSLKDVQQLAGHRSLETTQGYIEGDSKAQRKLIDLL